MQTTNKAWSGGQRGAGRRQYFLSFYKYIIYNYLRKNEFVRNQKANGH